MKRPFMPYFFYGLIALVLTGLVAQKACAPEPQPIAAVQAAADRAATARATVTAADGVIAAHQRTTKQVVAQKKQIVNLKARRDTLDALIADSIPTPQIAVRDSIIAQQDSVIETLTATSDTLAKTLETTRDTLSFYQTPIIAATKTSHVKLGITAGYAAVYDGTLVTGPGAVAGLHLTNGVLGVTVGAGIVVAEKVRIGAAIGVGVRVAL